MVSVLENLSIGADSAQRQSLPTYKPHHTCDFEVPLRVGGISLGEIMRYRAWQPKILSAEAEHQPCCSALEEAKGVTA